MNKFLKNKKKEDGVAATTPAPAASKKLFGRSKKPEPAPVPEVNLNIALPSSDDFRTSLIMPNLSARFSMLRDQDNPGSLIGKASDDSVLAPRRRSRLGFADFSGNALGDIAEIESIRCSFRPPYAEDSRANSYHSAAENTDDESPTSPQGGSIMSRARPGEGNVLFGGRQKVYRIPVSEATSATKGRALYEDDIQTSAFQKYREEQRRQERERKLAELEREMHQDESPKDSLYSPALSAYDEKRTTSSSTNSGPSMASTAATSVVSQPACIATSPVLPPGPSSATAATTPTTVQRSNSRRLYDQNLDRHMNEQQTEKLTRLNSLSRKPSNGRPRLNHSKSATTLRDRYDLGSDSLIRAASPQLPTSESLTAIDAARSPEASNPSQFNFGFNNLPNVAEDPLVQAVDKQDRGKATALGQFNRPRQFNEEQFLSRQRSLARQRNNSRQRRPTGSQSPQVLDSAVASPAPSSQTSATGSRRPSGESTLRGHSPAASRPRAGTIYSERSSSLSYQRDGQSPEDRARSGSAGSQSSRKQPPAPLRPESLHHPSSLPTLEPAKSNEPRLSPVIDVTPSKISFERGTEDDVPAPLQASPPPLQDHPAMRIGSPERPSSEKRRGWSPEDLAGKFNYNAPSLDTTMEVPSIDVDRASPQHTLAPGPHSGLRLGGFVREHLRQVSNVSSVYDLEDREPMAADHTRGASVMFTPSSTLPWHEGQPLGRVGEGEQLAVSQRADTPGYLASLAPPVPPVPTAVPTEPLRAQQLHVQPRPQQLSIQTQQGATAQKSTSPAIGSTRSEFDPQNLKASDAAQWIDDLKKQHTQQQQHAREMSTDTINERRAFAEDLRERQKAIQENLRIKNENNSRNASPLASSGKGFDTSFNPFGLIRKASGKENARRDGKGRPPTGPTSGNGEAHGSPSKPPGRTLHMKMAGGDDTGFEITGLEHPQLRPDSVATRSTLADSERPSTSRDESSTTRSSSASGLSGRAEEEKVSVDVHRRDFPSTFPSTHPTAHPSVDIGRTRAQSSASSRPPVPPIPIETPMPPVPRAVAPETLPKGTRSATASPAISAKGTPPLSSASSMTDMRPPASSSGNHAASPLNHSRSASPAVSTTSSFAFPTRPPAERPAAPIRKRSPSIKKSAISQPTLLSSTSNFETVDLAEKRAALGRGKVAAVAAEINATSAAIGETWTAHDIAGKPPSVPPMGPATPVRTKGFFQRRNPEPTSPKLSEHEAGDDDDDDFMTRPDGGRMRVRAVSDAKGFGRRYEATSVSDEHGMQGGMF